jgi:N-acetylmuramic acid 6-phosphate (MurNAc-6-P) etherase
MINVQATNDKLRARAVRLVQALSSRDAGESQAALEKQCWRVGEAVESLKKRKH